MNKIIIVPSMMSFNNGTVTTNQGSFKVIPDLITSPTTITVNGGGSYSQTVTLGPTVSHSTTMPMIIDPLRDHLDWYGFSNETSWSPHHLSTSTITEKLSSMAEFSTMLEEHMNDVVLIQKFGYDSWHLYCRDPNDKLKIMDLLNKLTPLYITLLKFPEELERKDWPDFVKEVMDWCYTTCKDKFRVTNSYHSLNGVFRSDSDAALFKLKYTYA